MTGLELGGAAVADDVPLAPLTTLRIGPVARRLITCTSTEQVVGALRATDAGSSPACGRVLVLAGGSNVVLADDLADLTVVLLANTEISVEGNIVRAEAGAVWDDVVVTSLAYGLGGLECLSGIPGSAGATPVQNVGAYGAEVADTIRRVRLLDRRTGEDRWVSPDVLQFGYRTSILRHSQAAVVLEVEFALDAEGRSAPLRYGELAAALDAEPGSRADPARVREAVLSLRAGKGMVLDEADHDTWSVGSFFTNPVVSPAEYERLKESVDRPVPSYPAPDGVKLAAGWLVERAGFGKGYPGDGAPARLSTKHALALTNRGNATTADVIALARTVRDGVRTTFGIELTPEPILIGAAF
ncbi:UDP-N-acetylmuramate dehydrogenase [Mycobacterium sp.]|uniref:UDP-N-acetylmuramate dehydrogenase n=1 Tax=Mycobacterium sp. TaxID=1785 RepID=UPI002CCCDBFC|nr:UDP-N-acetylmuramate dehydrogenase [Mycobacterium sp.]HTH89093.1 UDP-N-acetylmuramate dehydrogenase [Mycobacterium sp.]